MQILTHERQEDSHRVWTVAPLLRDRNVVDETEKKIRSVPNFLPTKRTLWSILSEPGTAIFTVDDVGVVGAFNIRQGLFGEVHITFWDRKLRGRASLCYELSQFLMESAQLQFLLTYIPNDKEKVLRFAYDVGFRTVEIMNDVVVMALLRENKKWESKQRHSSLEESGQLETPPGTFPPDDDREEWLDVKSNEQLELMRDFKSLHS